MSKIDLKSQDKGDLTKGVFSVSLFLVFNQTSNNFFETPYTFLKVIEGLGKLFSSELLMFALLRG